MIFDRIENIGAYRGLSRNMDTAIDAILNMDFDHLSEDRREIDGSRVFCFGQNIGLRAEGEGRYEIHRRYADIQISLGGEIIRYLPLRDISRWQEFDEARDIGFSADCDAGMDLVMSEGTFAIFFPQDAHMPCMMDGEHSATRKLVVKVRMEE